MKQITKIIFIATSLFIATFIANAQVRIGDNTLPVAGSVLDLSSASGHVGGLHLPNVTITNLGTIPSTFSDAAAQGKDNAPELTGLVVYNTATNAGLNIFPGFYIWDGDNWQQLPNKTDISTMITNGGDNLGNHLAATTLNMRNYNIDSIASATVNRQITFKDWNAATYTKAYTLYKNNGTLGIWNELAGTNDLIINETSRQTIVNNLAISNIPAGAATDNLITVDAIGNIRKTSASTMAPTGTSQMVAFVKSSLSNSTFTSGDLFFDTTVFDSESGVHLGSTTTDYMTYTIKKAGIYQIFFNFSFLTATPAGPWSLHIKKNGGTIAAMDGVDSKQSTNLNTIDSFNVGDKISVDKTGSNSGWVPGFPKVAIFRIQ